MTQEPGKHSLQGQPLRFRAELDKNEAWLQGKQAQTQRETSAGGPPRSLGRTPSPPPVDIHTRSNNYPLGCCFFPKALCGMLRFSITWIPSMMAAP